MRHGGLNLPSQSRIEQSTAEFPLEPGDCFEVRITARGSDRAEVVLPASMADVQFKPRQIEEPSGREIWREPPCDDGSLIIDGDFAPKLLAEDAETIWLKYIAPHRYRLQITSKPPSGAAEIAIDDKSLIRQAARCTDPMEFQVGLRAARLSTQPGFDELISLPMVREMDVLEHQTRTAVAVLRRMRGRGMLCDEVGLGKTIEAGLILRRSNHRSGRDRGAPSRSPAIHRARGAVANRRIAAQGESSGRDQIHRVAHRLSAQTFDSSFGRAQIGPAIAHRAGLGSAIRFHRRGHLSCLFTADVPTADRPQGAALPAVLGTLTRQRERALSIQCFDADLRPRSLSRVLSSSCTHSFGFATEGCR